jgi:Spy/CpxP family protein refolding chaperone
MMTISTRNLGRRPALLALLALLVIPTATDAQQRRPRPERAQMEAQLRQRFQGLVVRELGLDEDRGRALAEAVREFQEPRRELFQRQRGLERRLTGTGALLSEDEARAVLDELVGVKEEEARLMALEQERLLEILTPPQLVRFYTLRDQLSRRIRQLRENRPGGGGPDGPLPPGETLAGWPVFES